MPEDTGKPRPHGDPLTDEVVGEENRAQRQSDAPPDATVDPDIVDRAEEKGYDNTANGIAPFDEAEGEIRRRQYRDGAGLVSRLD
jgi:hypothetical protein